MSIPTSSRSLCLPPARMHFCVLVARFDVSPSSASNEPGCAWLGVTFGVGLELGLQLRSLLVSYCLEWPIECNMWTMCSMLGVW